MTVTIRIGPYTLQPFHGKAQGIWIEHDDGEGMQISNAKFLAWLERLLDEEF